MGRTLTNLILLQILMLLTTGNPARAAVALYDNSDQGPADGLPVLSEYRTFAQPFTTGDEGFDSITSVTLTLQRIGSPRGASVRVEIWDADGAGLPRGEIGTVGRVSINSLSTSLERVTVKGSVPGLKPSSRHFVCLKVLGSTLSATKTVRIGVLTEDQGAEAAEQALVRGGGESPWTSLAGSGALHPDAVDASALLQMAVLAVDAGRTEYTFVTSPGLVVNRIGDPATRRALVYLPPGYGASQKRYPVVYLLGGSGVNEDTLTETGVHGIAEQLINEGTTAEMILVSVDPSTAYLTSYYTNSELHGYHEDYLVRHLVDHIDATYRTIAQRNSRGVWGHSTGGYGALLFGMKYAHIFAAVYSASGGYFCWSLPGCAMDLSGNKVQWSPVFRSLFGTNDSIARSLAPASQVFGNSAFLKDDFYSMAAAYSVNLANPPFYVDLPFDPATREIRPNIRDKWSEHELTQMLPDHVADLRSLRGIALDIGNRDEWGLFADNELFHHLLLEAGVPHGYQVFSGAHMGSWPLRLPWMLTFFTEMLDAVSPNGLGESADPNGSDASAGPRADAGEDRVVNISADQETVGVQLDAGASQPGSAVPLTYDWYEDNLFLGEGPTLEIALPVGRHVCHLVVTDAEGRQDGTDVIVYVHRPGLP